MSVFLAFYLEVIPLEADLIYGPLRNDIFRIIILKVSFLILIFFPIMIYIMRNGLSALKSVWGRVTVVAIIVVFNLAFLCLYFLKR
jgi:hypothetical protein